MCVWGGGLVRYIHYDDAMHLSHLSYCLNDFSTKSKLIQLRYADEISIVFAFQQNFIHGRHLYIKVHFYTLLFLFGMRIRKLLAL